MAVTLAITVISTAVNGFVMTKSAAFVMVTVYIIYLVQAIVMAEG
jgi:hypothetical protein